jgi:hypothetical protein
MGTGETMSVVRITALLAIVLMTGRCGIMPIENRFKTRVYDLEVELP